MNKTVTLMGAAMVLARAIRMRAMIILVVIAVASKYRVRWRPGQRHADD